MKVRRFVPVVGMLVVIWCGPLGCSRAVTDGLAIGLTDGLSDGLSQVISDFVTSLSSTDE